MYAAVVYGVILLVVFVFSLWALMRASRRYRERLLHKPTKPTPVPDVWKMHKLPPGPHVHPPDQELEHEP